MYRIHSSGAQFYFEHPVNFFYYSNQTDMFKHINVS
jgi:hypothetical protein